MKIVVDKMPEFPLECAFNEVHQNYSDTGYEIPIFMCKLSGNYSVHPCELTRDEKKCPYLISM